MYLTDNMIVRRCRRTLDKFGIRVRKYRGRNYYQLLSEGEEYEPKGHFLSLNELIDYSEHKREQLADLRP